MAYLEETELVRRSSRITRPLLKSAASVLLEAGAAHGQQFDVFLSHSSSEPDAILLGVKDILEDEGLSVYVDKYSDPELSPEKVTWKTADLLRHRMQSSSALLYVHSQHSTRSRWMPWELGYFDGLKSRVGVLPVANKGQTAFKGEEFLALYPYVDVAVERRSQKRILWINRAPNTYAGFQKWAKGEENIRRRSF